MKPPKDIYLWKNANGAYYFRERLPDSHCIALGKSEIKISLKTASHKEARLIAYIYKAELQILNKGDHKAPSSHYNPKPAQGDHVEYPL